MEFLAWVESTAFSTWIRESPSMFAFPGFLVLHAIGMGFLAGTNAALDLRILGFASGIPVSLMEKFFPVMWFGFVVNAVSGVLLLIAYPTKALTNPVFYLKLGCIAAGLALAFRLRRTVIRNPASESAAVSLNGRLCAVFSLGLWAIAITAGRFLAYTCTYLMADSTC